MMGESAILSDIRAKLAQALMSPPSASSAGFGPDSPQNPDLWSTYPLGNPPAYAPPEPHLNEPGTVDVMDDLARRFDATRDIRSFVPSPSNGATIQSMDGNALADIHARLQEGRPPVPWRTPK